MNPCRICLKSFGDSLCADLGHCVWEGSNEKPDLDVSEDVVAELEKTPKIGVY